jgi:uncharacterized protein with NRDE domain
VCLIAFAWQADANYPLIVAANRDEFFARPTTAAAWSDDGRRLSGRDLKAGGTWMGATRDGRFAALTNHRDPAAFRPDAPSRGELVDRFLDAVNPDDTLSRIAAERARFNGFNLLAARWDTSTASMAIVSHPGVAALVPVEPGIHALSNAHLDTAWPKVVAITDGLRAALRDASGRDELVDRLFALLGDGRVAPDDALPRTGISLDWERALSAAFIRTGDYGTRSSTVYVVDRDGDALFVERRCEPDQPVDERRFAFALNATHAS